MDRLFVAELPPLTVVGDGSAGYVQQSNFTTDYRNVSGITTLFVHEQKIDLAGYLKDDLTMFYRNSFEQNGGLTSVNYFASTSKPLRSFTASFLETVIVSTVPLTDDNLVASVVTYPGFTVFPGLAVDPGNFNREQIIHGSSTLHGVDTTMGADPLDDAGSAYMRIINYDEFSSLEPTATEYLYVYRLVSFSASGDALLQQTGLTQVGLAAKRVIMSASADKEEDIPYLMRLKRGYELANQV